MDELDELISVFDKAITSKDPRIQDALRKFLFIVAITSGEDDQNQFEGPISRMLQSVRHLEARVEQLEYVIRNRGPWQSSDSIYNPPTRTSSGTGPAPTYPPYISEDDYQKVLADAAKLWTSSDTFDK